MLREIHGIRQYDDEPTRRWFTDHYWDLFIWHDSGTVKAFQLCYGKPDAEHSVSWRDGRGFAHHRIDDGEGHPASHRTPILVADGKVDAGSVLDRFAEDSQDIDPAVSRIVRNALESLAQG